LSAEFFGDNKDGAVFLKRPSVRVETLGRGTFGEHSRLDLLGEPEEAVPRPKAGLEVE